jgi:hypothetical protein
MSRRADRKSATDRKTNSRVKSHLGFPIGSRPTRVYPGCQATATWRRCGVFPRRGRAGSERCRLPLQPCGVHSG